jgi:hypothetical protein
LKDSKAKNKKSNNKDSTIIGKNNGSLDLDGRREEQIPKTSSFSWEPQVNKYDNRPTSLAHSVSFEAATSTTTSHWLQQMVDSVKATPKPTRNDFFNEDIIFDELICTSLADFFSSEPVASTTATRSHWLQAHEVSLLECGFQMVGSAKATTKPTRHDFSNEDIIDELISTFQGYGSATPV